MTNTGMPRNYGGGSLGPDQKSLEELKKPPTFMRKQRYLFDNTLAKGAKAMIGWLLAAAAIASIPFTIVDLPRPRGAATAFFPPVDARSWIV